MSQIKYYFILLSMKVKNSKLTYLKIIFVNLNLNLYRGNDYKFDLKKIYMREYLSKYIYK